MARMMLKSWTTIELKHMKKHLPIHPGEVLREDFLMPLGLSEYRLAKDLGVPPRRINEIVKGKRAVTADTALRLSRYFGWPAEVWLNLQSRYDRQIAEAEMQSVLKRIKPCSLVAA
jgi:addiction module HigA family antidote